MLRIGVVGEYPTDVACISTLLLKKYKEYVSFFTLIFDIHGSMLDNPKIKHLIRKSFEIQKPDFVLFIRDLDGLEDHTEKLALKKENFSFINSVVDRKGLLLLNIYELEALLLTHMDLLVEFYKTPAEEISDCMKIADPKGYLKTKFQKYSTGDNLVLFEKLDFDKVVEKCRYFRRFNEAFRKITTPEV